MKKNQNIEKMAFKVVQMKFFIMHNTNKKFSFDIFTVGNVQNIFMEPDLYFISYYFDPNVFLAIATNIPQRRVLCMCVYLYIHNKYTQYVNINLNAINRP